MKYNEDLPKVSILIVTHNDERSIRNCLDSMQNQDYSNTELIVVDACSHDSTVTIAKDYADKILELKTNTLGESRQISVENSTGDFLAIMDADVVLPPKWISKAILEFDKNIGIVWSYNEPPANSSIVARCFFQFWKEIMTDRIESRRAPFVGSNSLYLRKAVEDVGGFDRYSHYSEDLDLAVRIQKFGYNVAILNIPIVHDTMYSLRKYTKNQLWAARDFSKHGLNHSNLSLWDIAYEHIYLSTRGLIKGVFKDRKFSWLLLPVLLLIRIFAYAIAFSSKNKS